MECYEKIEKEIQLLLFLYTSHIIARLSKVSSSTETITADNVFFSEDPRNTMQWWLAKFPDTEILNGRCQIELTNQSLAGRVARRD